MNGDVAQLVVATRLEREIWEFESLYPHHARVVQLAGDANLKS